MDAVRVLKALLSEGGWSQERLADRLHTTQPTISRWLNGDREPRGRSWEELRILATESGLLNETHQENHIVKIVGRVGGGAVIAAEFEQAPSEDDALEQVELPYPVGDNWIGFRVEGDSMAPTYEQKAIILVEREQPYPTEQMVGMTAAVLAYNSDSEKVRYLKRILRGAKPKTFDLESINDRSPTIKGVRIIWASPVRMIVPNIGLRRVPRKARARAGQELPSTREQP